MLFGLGLWGISAAALRAQPEGLPTKQPQVARCYVNKNLFNLPLNMTQQTRASITEVQLYCLDNANGNWKLLSKCPPNQTGFDFDSKGEGEFCFTLCLVDPVKGVVPERPELSENKMAVVVDMTPPKLDAQFLNMNKDGYLIRVDTSDANLDPRRTVVEYQTLNKDWRALGPIMPEANHYCIPKEAAITGMVRVSAADLAENVASKEFDLPQLSAAAKSFRASFLSESTQPVGPIKLTPLTAPAAIEPPFQVGILPSQVPPANNPPPPSVCPCPTQKASMNHYVAPVISVAPMAPPSTKIGPCQPSLTIFAVEDVSDRVQSPNGAAVQPKIMPAPVTPPSRIDVPAPATPIRDDDAIMQRMISPTSQVEINPDVRAAAVNASATKATVTTTSANSPAPPCIPRRLINQRQVRLDYRLEHVGASGVGKVEVWITADQCQSWQKLCDDAERKSPVAVELPGEGLYGVLMVVSNGRGFGGTPPNPGDAPDTWVEVDMTRPIVEIKDIRSGGADDPGTVHVAWSAHDRNLAADAVDLYYATQRDGTWTPIAKGLRNDYHYRWAPPPSVGSHVFIRLVAHDQAGNMTVVETSHPFAVDDMSRPRGKLIGVVPLTGDVHLESIVDR